ncbi:MAG: DUF11 domain-containing protein [Proteobacteria bacterium]|nr:DUF11 domain-containing protein [Pseudomonadota bacterium]
MRAINYIVTTLFLSLLGINSAMAEQGSIEIKIEVKKVEITTVYGEKKVREVEAKTVVPGDELLYTVFFKNIDRVPVDNIAINDPIPDATRYKEGSAFGAGTEITFSVDGGKSYAKPDDLTVTNKKGETRKAQAEDYTNIQWVFRPKLAPGKTGTAQFRVIVK